MAVMEPTAKIAQVQDLHENAGTLFIPGRRENQAKRTFNPINTL